MIHMLHFTGIGVIAEVSKIYLTTYKQQNNKQRFLTEVPMNWWE